MDVLNKTISPTTVVPRRIIIAPADVTSSAIAAQLAPPTLPARVRADSEIKKSNPPIITLG